MIELRGRAFGTLQQGFGGDTLNTAVYLARLCRNEDILVSYATALGTDSFSDQMIAAWCSEGVDTSLVRRLDDRLPDVDANPENYSAVGRLMCLGLSDLALQFNGAANRIDRRIEC